VLLSTTWDKTPNRLCSWISSADLWGDSTGTGQM
jgi:hypothetical protein